MTDYMLTIDNKQTVNLLDIDIKSVFFLLLKNINNIILLKNKINFRI